MNTLLWIGVCAILLLPIETQAQTRPRETTTFVTFAPESALFKSGGFLYQFVNGRAVRVESDVRVSDRVTVKANGSVLKDGNVFTVPDGQVLYPDGSLEQTPPGFAPPLPATGQGHLR